MPLGPGYASIARGDFEAALQECTAALANGPARAEILCTRAWVRRGLADLPGALADAGAAVQSDAANAWAHRTLGEMCLAVRKPRTALACCDEAVRLDPGLAHGFITRGMANLMLGEFPAALADGEQAVRLGPNLWGAYLTRGNARYHLFDANAIDDYQIGFQMNPRAHTETVMHYIADQSLREPWLLFRNCRKHLDANPRDAVTYNRLGLAQVFLFRDADGQRNLERAILLDAGLRERIELLTAEAKRVRELGPPPWPMRELDLGFVI